MPPRSPSSPVVPPAIPDRDPDRRRARAWTALGFLTGCTLVWGSIAALNHWFLGFHAWPQTDEPGVQRLVVTAPAARAARTPALVRRVGVAPNGGVLAIFPAAGDGAPVTGTTVTTTAGRRSNGGTRIPATGPGGVLAPDRAPDAQSDPDGDGVPNAVERRRGTSPTNADSDGDGMPDAWEVSNGLDPKNSGDATQDSDGDGVPNGAEFRLGDDPRRVDTGRTGTGDGEKDSDGDGVSNADEIARGTDPAVADQPSEPAAPPQTGQEPTPGTGEEPQPEQPAEPQPTPEPTPEPQPAEPAPAEPQPVPEPQLAQPPATDPTTGGVEAPTEPPVTAPAPAPERSQAPEAAAPAPAPEAAAPTPAP